MGTGSGAFLIDAFERLAANPPFLGQEDSMAKVEIFDQLGQELDAESKEIELTRGKTAIVDAEDYEWLMQWKWYTHTDGTNWYAARNSKYKKGRKRPQIRMHRVIMSAPVGLEVDHIDGNGLNNQRNNLRLCNHAQNKRNSRKQVNNISGFKGVSLHKGMDAWRARITANGKAIVLGYFATPEEAARAYDNAAHKLHGEFARVNFPGETR